MCSAKINRGMIPKNHVFALCLCHKIQNSKMAKIPVFKFKPKVKASSCKVSTSSSKAAPKGQEMVFVVKVNKNYNNNEELVGTIDSTTTKEEFKKVTEATQKLIDTTERVLASFEDKNGRVDESGEVNLDLQRSLSEGKNATNLNGLIDGNNITTNELRRWCQKTWVDLRSTEINDAMKQGLRESKLLTLSPLTGYSNYWFNHLESKGVPPTLVGTDCPNTIKDVDLVLEQLYNQMFKVKAQYVVSI
jgi:hypothetical protein